MCQSTVDAVVIKWTFTCTSQLTSDMLLYCQHASVTDTQTSVGTMQKLTKRTSALTFTANTREVACARTVGIIPPVSTVTSVCPVTTVQPAWHLMLSMFVGVSIS